ncbi:MAG: dehydrogenase [Labilithrix sp.]|nr:dehydrogenase [Labilithrix sp.]
MFSRRDFLSSTGAAVVATGAFGLVNCSTSSATAQGTGSRTPPGPIKLPRLFDGSEQESEAMPAPLAPDARVGVAVVGLGRLSLEAILPGIAASKRCRLVGLVSGERAKAQTVAAQYGVSARSIYDYANMKNMRDDRAIELVYVVLPNSMHAEYTAKAFEAGKHVLCEKPMASTVAEAQSMIDASEKAKKKLMIAYRLQYEPHHREAIRMARAGELGRLVDLVASNGQTQGDPAQWRLRKAMAGGGALPDIGIYCLNAARYLTGEEPVEVAGMMHSTPGDPRFTEVDEHVSFSLRFPSGLLASCSSSYSAHQTKTLRLLGDRGWADFDPAFSYEGLQLRVGKKQTGGDDEEIAVRRMKAPNQFAAEMDHMASCILEDRRPHTPGEEGLQDMKLMAAIYEAMQNGRTVKLPAVPGKDAFRGPPPAAG